MVFSVNYNEGALELIDCQNGVALSALAFQEPSRLINGCNFVWYGSETGEVTDGEMLILTFEIAEDYIVFDADKSSEIVQEDTATPIVDGTKFLIRHEANR